MNNNHQKLDMTALAALLVFAVFAVCILLVLLTGADVYKRLVDKRQQTYDSRTMAQYLTTRVRQADQSGSIATEDFEGVSALVLREEIHGEDYLTRVYAYDGYLRELFTAADGSFHPADGEIILEADTLSFSLTGNTLTVFLEPHGGQTQVLTLFLRSGREVQP